MPARFAVGQVVATPGALDLLEEYDTNPFALISRHQRGDWGDLDEEDKRANEAALKTADLRLFSAYYLDSAKRVKLWVITDRAPGYAVTTILRPEDY